MNHSYCRRGGVTYHLQTGPGIMYAVAHHLLWHENSGSGFAGGILPPEGLRVGVGTGVERPNGILYFSYRFSLAGLKFYYPSLCEVSCIVNVILSVLCQLVDVPSYNLHHSAPNPRKECRHPSTRPRGRRNTFRTHLEDAPLLGFQISMA